MELMPKQSELFEKVMHACQGLNDLRYFFFGGAIRGGKLLPLDTMIPTPTGWATMGNLQSGDIVIDCNGNPTKVNWVSEITNNPEAWQLIFDDGSTAICDIGHQWVTTTRKDRIRILRASSEFRDKRKSLRTKRGTGKKPWLSLRNSEKAKLLVDVPDKRGSTKTTKEIIETLYDGRFVNHAIVNCDPLNLPEKSLIIKPYTLGAWLGDGTSCSGGFTGIDPEIWESIESEGYKVSHHKHPQSHCIIGLLPYLKQSNVFNNKHIPQEYLRSSIEQRLSLLQGLCDTDGYCNDKKGSIEFTTTSEKIKNGFLELIYSFGIKPSCREGVSTLNGIKHGKKWRIQFWFNMPCFRIKRKLIRQKMSLGDTRHYRAIVSAIPVLQVPMKCISVDSPSKTYLCGKEMIPTHNTYSIIVVLRFLCASYPNSKWHVVRKDMTVLLGTTIPSFEKVLAGDQRWKWARSSGNYHVTYLPTGSKVFFKPESLQTDPELNDFLGLETNGFFLEQIEELSEAMWARAIERAGSWYLVKMPPAFIFSSFNPTNRWVKAFVHDKWVEGTLQSPFCYIQALTTDNKYVTADQWKAWENMDEASYRNLIEGSWVFEQDGNTFIYSFRERENKSKKPGYAHIVKGLEILPDLPVYISMDFNLDPICALVCQFGNKKEWISIIDEIRLANSDIYQICERIEVLYPNAYFYITGDASGRNRSAMTKGSKNYYYIIKHELKLNNNRFKIPSVNPSIKNSRVLCNSILAKHPAVLIDERCRYLIEDFRFVIVDDDGDIDKKKDAHRSHLLDCFRYFCNTFFFDFIHKT